MLSRSTCQWLPGGRCPEINPARIFRIRVEADRPE